MAVKTLGYFYLFSHVVLKLTLLLATLCCKLEDFKMKIMNLKPYALLCCNIGFRFVMVT